VTGLPFAVALTGRSRNLVGEGKNWLDLYQSTYLVAKITHLRFGGSQNFVHGSRRLRHRRISIPQHAAAPCRIIGRSSVITNTIIISATTGRQVAYYKRRIHYPRQTQKFSCTATATCTKHAVFSKATSRLKAVGIKSSSSF
jgi:hypothetical protein